ncbi:hypothetical protein ATO13_22061 [Stappia sp. 22II-S9-Z10]|nr:hypothetical protein ATO13_22061 [Stappia sp. 22II-S9-Z10]
MTDLTPTIRARLIEAAKTERKLPPGRVKPGEPRSVWPTAGPPTRAEMNQWGGSMTGARKAGIRPEQRVLTAHPAFDPDDPGTWRMVDVTRLDGHSSDVAAAMSRETATAAEVTRMDEALRWVVDLVTDPGNRRAVLAWALAKAGGRPVRSWARNVEGVTEHTAKRRADRAIAQIAAHFANDPRLLASTGAQGLFNEAADFDTHFPTLDDCGCGDGPSPRAWMDSDAKPVAPVTTEDFQRSEAGVAEAAQRAREMARRRKLGATG